MRQWKKFNYDSDYDVLKYKIKFRKKACVLIWDAAVSRQKELQYLQQLFESSAEKRNSNMVLQCANSVKNFVIYNFNDYFNEYLESKLCKHVWY